MLTKVHIRGFRSCQDVKLDNLSYLVALVGRNGAGKTSILKAIEWMAQVATGGQSAVASMRHRYDVGTPAFEIGVLVDGIEYEYSISTHIKSDLAPTPESRSSFLPLVISYNENLKVKIAEVWVELFNRVDNLIVACDMKSTKNDHLNYHIPSDTSAIVVLSAILPPEDPTADKVRKLSGFLSRIRYYPVDETAEPTNPFDVSSYVFDSAYKKYLSNTKPGISSDPIDSSFCIKLVHMYLTKDELFKDLVEYVGPKNLRLIDGITVQTLNVGSANSSSEDSIHMLRFQLEGRRRRFTYGELSLGTRKILHILLALLYDESSVMLIEHPEDGIHPGLLSRLVSLVDTAKDPTQIFLTSHSVTLLNSMKPSNVKLVTMNDDTVSTRSLTDSEVTSASDYICNEGTLSEFLEAIQPE